MDKPRFEIFNTASIRMYDRMAVRDTDTGRVIAICTICNHNKIINMINKDIIMVMRLVDQLTKAGRVVLEYDNKSIKGNLELW